MTFHRALRWIIAAVLIVPLGYCTTIGALNYSGYCFEQGRYVPDEELMKRSIAAVLDHYAAIRFVPDEMPSVGRPAPSQQKNFRASDAKGVEITKDQLVLYADAEEFLALNPGCCNFSRRGLYGEVSDTPFTWKIFGRSAGFFNAKYQIRYRDSSGQIQSRWTGATFHFTNCGQSSQYYY